MRTETVIVGAGQAGLSLSRRLTRAGRAHVVLDRGRIGERWRSERWDSLTLLSPNWLNRLDGGDAHADPHGFLGKNAFVEYLERYAADAPVQQHVEVRRAWRPNGAFRVETSAGTWDAQNLVVATGDSADPFIPSAVRSLPGILQIHASRYHNPAALPVGAVLVVGAGPTGQQLAAELARAGRRVVLAVGRHRRDQRRYRGRDVFHWLNELGDLDRPREELPPTALKPHSLAVTGAHGGEQLDLAVLHALGVTLAGRVERFEGTRALFSGDLRSNAAEADEKLSRLLDRIDASVSRDWPHDPDRLAPASVPPGPTALDLAAAGVRTVVWATGYRRSYPWLDLDVLDERGEIAQDCGITPVNGLYVLGRNFQCRRSSHWIGGVGRDAATLAARIAFR